MQIPKESPTAAVLALALGTATPAIACWEDAAARYRVAPTLLYAIARTESGVNPLAIGRNRDGSRDIGLMQINSGWLPTLARHGIGEPELLDPCTNLHVGAWVLAQAIHRHGYTWEAVGAYNAVTPARRRAYVARVQRQLEAAMVEAGAAPVARIAPADTFPKSKPPARPRPVLSHPQP